MSALLILTWLVPLLSAAFAANRRSWWLPAVAALPALATAALIPSGELLEIPWLLLGSALGLDTTSRLFLGFTAILWLVAGLYTAGDMRSATHAGRFRIFFLLAMAGNFWLIVGQDLVSFYTGFSLMGLAAYGLVVHNEDRFALRAGKVYLVMTLVGELCLFVALVLVASQTETPRPQSADLTRLSDLTIGLLLAGLAIKAGLVPLHVWLPLAHPAAPVPASAVLSGAMIKVALLAWLRFLPIGEVAMTGWGLLLVVVGAATYLYALPIGLVQTNPKVILAYSSIGKMGLMSLALGLVMLEPDLASGGIMALCLYAAHHALAKGGLFLGVGLRHKASRQVAVLIGIAVLALSLAAVPLSGGAVAKYAIKPVLAATDWPWLGVAIALSAIGTALLMARFCWVIWRATPHPSGGQVLGGVGWSGLVALILLYPLVLGKPDAWATNTLLTLIALVLALPFVVADLRKPALVRLSHDPVPPGDLLGLARRPILVWGYGVRRVEGWWNRLLERGARRLRVIYQSLGPPPQDPESSLRRWPSTGAAWLAITALLLLLPLSSLTAFRPAQTTEEAVPPAPAAQSPGAPAEPVEPEAPPTPQAEVARHPPEDLSADETQEAKPSVHEAEPHVEPEPPLPAKQDPPADLGQRGDECDATRPFELGHARSTESVTLRDCVAGPDGRAVRLAAPALTQELVRLIQRHLDDLGYSPGPIDGLMGPNTRGAIQRFQSERGEDATGGVTFSFLKRLIEEVSPQGASEL